MGLVSHHSRSRTILYESISFCHCYYFGKHGLITDQNIYFNWIPKTAGASVSQFLFTEFDLLKIVEYADVHKFEGKGCVTFGHNSYLDLRALGIISDSFHNNSFKFSIVRCPYTRAVSLYNYFNLLYDKGVIKQKIPLYFKLFLTEVCLKRPPIGLINSRAEKIFCSTNPQTDWLISNNATFWVDKIYKLENLRELEEDFYNRYNVKFDPEKKYNKSPNRYTIEELFEDNECIDLINKIYYRDFELLNYRMR